MKKHSLTFIEILTIIIFITMIIVLFISKLIEKNNSSTEKAFFLEGIKICGAAEYAIKKIPTNELKLDDDCYEESASNDNVYCFTIDTLINNKLYLTNSNNLKGKIVVESNNDNTSYTLFLTDGNLKIINSQRKKYIGFDTLSNDPWIPEYEICNCQKN